MTAQGLGPENNRTEEGISVVMASPEVAPYALTGGLGDVVGSLPAALRKLGLSVSTVMPAYRSVMRKFPLETTGRRFTVLVAARREGGLLLQHNSLNHAPAYFLRADKYFDREGLYGSNAGDYPDNAERFVFFARALLEVLRADPPHVLHLHDWQPALAAAFLRLQPQLYPELSGTKTVLTIHNLGYQGLFPASDWPALGLDQANFTPGLLEFYGKINFLKAGIVTADAITTVSRSYAREIEHPDHGFGLDGVIRAQIGRVTGIMNGVDYEAWNPETDKHIAAAYRAGDMTGKAACKAALQREFGLPLAPETPVIGMVSRLAEQKGFDLLENALGELMRQDVQLIVVGTGEKHFHDTLSGAASFHRDRMAVGFGFDVRLAHRVIAGSDMLLMPSRYEPGGLTPLYAMRYGAIPIVRATGGLKDTVSELDPRTGEGTGFAFVPYEPADLLAAVRRATDAFQQKELWARLMTNAMSADFSWDRSAKEYEELYRQILSTKS